MIYCCRFGKMIPLESRTTSNGFAPFPLAKKVRPEKKQRQ
jgi:hypothetical protein